MTNKLLGTSEADQRRLRLQVGTKVWHALFPLHHGVGTVVEIRGRQVRSAGLDSQSNIGKYAGSAEYSCHFPKSKYTLWLSLNEVRLADSFTPPDPPQQGGETGGLQTTVFGAQKSIVL